jgi:hypothetical protein
MSDDLQTPDVSQLVGDAAPARRARPEIPLWFALLTMVVALLIAVVILGRVAGPLFGLLFPPDVPVPDDVQEIEHIKPDKGTEYWIYRTGQSGRDVAAFYEDEGGACRYTSQGSLGETGERVEGVSYSVAHCQGRSESGGIVTSWEVYIAEGYPESEGPTIFRIYKYGEVN